jgi:hypothetical protein
MLAGHDRESTLSKKGDRARRVMAHLGLEREPYLSEFFGRDVLRSIDQPGDNGCDAAAIFE